MLFPSDSAPFKPSWQKGLVSRRPSREGIEGSHRSEELGILFGKELFEEAVEIAGGEARALVSQRKYTRNMILIDLYSLIVFLLAHRRLERATHAVLVACQVGNGHFRSVSEIVSNAIATTHPRSQ